MISFPSEDCGGLHSVWKNTPLCLVAESTNITRALLLLPFLPSWVSVQICRVRTRVVFLRVV